MTRRGAADTEALQAAADTFDSADPAAVEKQRKAAAASRRETLEAVLVMMGSRAGRRWMYDLLEAAHMFGTSFVQGDPYATAFREGERNLGLRLMSDIQEVAADLYIVMVREAKGLQ